MKRYTLIALTLLTFIFGCSSDDNESETKQEANIVINKNLNRQETGSSANDILSDNTFKSMVIELVYVEGFEPTETTVNNFVSFLRNRTFKPNGITVERREIPSPGKDSLSIQEIADIEIKERKNYNSDSQIAVWALFVDGQSENDTNTGSTLGAAYWNTSFVIFEKTIRKFSGRPFQPNRSLLETTVINHEFGHILGLTNLGTPLQSEHEDEEHPKHCDVTSCLMYWAAESGISFSNMRNMRSAPQLDAQCIADLRANGGK